LIDREGLTQSHAQGKCYGIWDNKKEAEMDKAKRPGSPNPGDYLIVEDREKPTTWHLPVKENGKPNHRLMGAAWAALHQGSRGNKYSGPGKSEAIAKLRRLYESEGIPLPSESKSSFTIYKTADGTYHWLAIFSNKYRDNDNPPEILSESAHLDFANAVKSGEWPLPELWLWHLPGSKWGTTELVAYDKTGGFSLAAGRVDKGKEAIAEALNSLPPEEVGVSHGMPTKEIQRDESDPSVIVRYRSQEISPLPLAAAANKLTSFQGVTLMELQPKEAEEKLQGWFGKEVWDKIVNLVDVKSKAAADAGLEFKEVEEEVPAEVESTDSEEKEIEEVALAEENKETTEAEETPNEPGESEDKEVDSYPKEELKEVLVYLADQLKSQAEMIQAQAARITELETEQSALKELAKSEEERIAKQAAWTTRAAVPSLREMIEGRVIGKEDVRVDGRTKEAQDRPQETKSPDPFTGNPGMDSVITDIRDMWKGDMVLGSALAPRHD